MALMSAQNVSVENRIHSVTLNLHAGEVMGLIGPNGSGKSTLLNCMAGLLPCNGEVMLQSQPLTTMNPRQRAQTLGLLPQRSNSAWSLLVRDVVGLGRLPWGDENSSVIEQAMRLAQVSEFASRSIDTLSGGEQARVWLARVLAGQPKVLLADEPMASLDLLYQQNIIHTLCEYATQGHAVMVAVHDLSLAARYCNRLALMNQGRLMAVGAPSEVLHPQVLSQVYGLDVMVNLDTNPPIVMAR